MKDPMDEGAARVRRENLRWLCAKYGRDEVCRRLNFTPQALSGLVGENYSRNVGSALKVRIEEAFDLPTGWMDDPLSIESQTLADIVKFARALPEEQRKILLQFLRSGMMLGKIDDINTSIRNNYTSKELDGGRTPKKRGKR